MTLGSANLFPYLTLVEGASPSNPAATDHRLYVDTADKLLKWRDSSGTVRLATGQPLGLTGAVSATRFVGGTASVAPTTGTFAVGDFITTAAGGIYVCTSAGTPGTWVAVGGTGSAALMGAKVFHSTTQSIANSAAAAVLFDSETYDTSAIHSTSVNTSRFTIPTGGDGYWTGVANINWAISGTIAYVRWQLGGVDIQGTLVMLPVGSSGENMQSVLPPIALVAGNYLEVSVYQNSGGARVIGDAATAVLQSSAAVWRVGT